MKLHDYWFHLRRDVLFNYVRAPSREIVDIGRFRISLHGNRFVSMYYDKVYGIWQYGLWSREPAFWGYTRKFITESQSIFDAYCKTKGLL